MLRLAVCDDDEFVVEQVESYIEKLKDISIVYEVYFSAEEFYSHMLELDFDVYFLDIEIATASGIQLAEKIRQVNQYALIIFMTSYPKYVTDVFDVNTFDFIVKPVTFEKFKKVVDKVSNYIFVSKTNFVFMHNKNQYALPYQNIIYIEKIKRKAYIHTNSEHMYECNITMEEILEQLSTGMFAKINRSCIVNLSMVDEIIRDEIHLINGETLYIARDYKMLVKEKHLNYFMNTT
ncbi:DNA-binding response regulator [Eubacterium sp. AF36-5BH]|uniref:LytR/AlgR family response regulator transcription factor n=1 Tax=Eubacterium sp. AF36-5BH TaxID=2293108 RepID=UPI000E506377|nr:LytTR family DNA-binding domain-containing protein [Eubacterium sp. AF36-5BH]RGF49427.1 DNA-binding response regulator [Eubacterium sp. AF36-5BH]